MNPIESGQDLTSVNEALILAGIAAGTAFIYWGGRVASKWIVENTYGAEFDEEQVATDQYETVQDFIENHRL